MGKERKIYLVRHSELYEEDGIHRCLGRTDVPLTERGKRQAVKTAKWFIDKNIERIYSSPLERCVKTAQIVKEALIKGQAVAEQTMKGQPRVIGQTPDIQVMDDLREMDAGAWENLSFEEIKEEYPEEYEARGKQLGYYAPPGGESFYQAGTRFGECLNKIRRETGGNILVVAHAGVIRGYLCSLLDISPNDVFSIPQPYAGVTVLQESCKAPLTLILERIGIRPPEFLDEEEIRYLYHKCDTPERVIRHMEAVAAYLDELATRIDPYKHSNYKWGLLKQAALAHDICRTSKDHAKAGADLLRMEGYEEVAELVRGHHSSEYCGKEQTCKEQYSRGYDNKGNYAANAIHISEEELLFYADKRVQDDRVVSVEERFQGSLEKCSTTEAREKHRKLYERTKYIEGKIESLIGGMER